MTLQESQAPQLGEVYSSDHRYASTIMHGEFALGRSCANGPGARSQPSASQPSCDNCDPNGRPYAIQAPARYTLTAGDEIMPLRALQLKRPLGYHSAPRVLCPRRARGAVAASPVRGGGALGEHVEERADLGR